MASKNYSGSCHCGKVKFRADADLSAGTSKCNCTMCSKGRFWKSVIPADDFRLVSGEGELTEYRFGSGNIQHLFCKTCGIKPFGRGELPPIGKFVAINLACLDGIDPAELGRAPVKFEDGLHNKWEATPTETRHL